jgi:hypothetical protein
MRIPGTAPAGDQPVQKSSHDRIVTDSKALLVLFLEKIQHLDRPDFMPGQRTYFRNTDSIKIQGITETSQEIIIGHGPYPFGLRLRAAC